MNFGELIKSRREQLGLTLEEVGNAAGLGKSHLHGLEHGNAKNPGLFTCVRLAVALGLNIQQMGAAILESNLEGGTNG